MDSRHLEVARKQISMTDQTYYKWRRKYGGLKIDYAKRIKELVYDLFRRIPSPCQSRSSLIYTRDYQPQHGSDSGGQVNQGLA